MKTTTLPEVPMPLRPLRKWTGALAAVALCTMLSTLLGCAGSSPPPQLVYLRTPSPAVPQRSRPGWAASRARMVRTRSS